MDLAKMAETLETMEKKSVDTLKNINERIEALQKDGVTKAEIKAFTDDLTKHAEDIKAVNDFAEALQKQFSGKVAEEKASTFNSMIEDMVAKNHAVILKGQGGKTPIELEASDYVSHKDMSFGGNTTGSVIAPDFDTRIYGQPFEVPHIRNLVRVGSTSSNAYYYIRATRKPGFAVGVGVQPGELKPEIQYQFDGKIAPVIKIAAHVRMPEELVEDIEGMTSYIQNYMPEDVQRAEDVQILYGDGSSTQFNGLFTQATTYVPTAGVNTGESWDVIADAMAQQMNIWQPATRGLINPIDWMFMVTRKSTDGIYSHPTLLAGANMSVNGMPLFPHPLVNVDSFLIGDFRQAELKVKKGLTVRWYDQDQDNAVKNMVTVVAELREAFAVYYPEAFKKGDFGRIS